MTDVRAMTASDRRFVVPTWARGARWRGLTTDEKFARVDRMLARVDTRVICIAGGNTVHAWAAASGTHLLYVYVPPELRRDGLARRVITALLGTYAEHIEISHPWPWASERFRFSPAPRMRTAA